MSDRMSRKWILKVPYTGPPKREYYDIVEEKLPALQDGGISHMISMLRTASCQLLIITGMKQYVALIKTRI